MALSDDLIAHWRLNEASGTREDAAGSNDLADNNTVTSGAGKLGDAAQFVAANSEYLSVADNAALSMGDIDFTVGAWVWFDDVTTHHVLVGKWAFGQDQEYQLWLEDNGGSIEWAWQVTSDNSSVTRVRIATTPSVDTWYYVLAYHDATADEIGLQVNNGTPQTAAHAGGVFDGVQEFRLGANGLGAYHDGRLDSVSIWKRRLTGDEATDLYNGGAGLDPLLFAVPVLSPALYVGPVG